MSFWNVAQIFECVEKKDDPQSFCISEITDSKNLVR